MAESRKVTKLFGAAGAALLALSGAALADGYEGSIKDAPKDEGRKFTYSFSITGTSDYVFRGISQTNEEAAVQGGVDLTCGRFYAGVWASSFFGDEGSTEIDLYAGFKTATGAINWDLGFIYYTYPGSFGGDANYFELKAGASGDIWKGGTLGATVFYTPEFSFNLGAVTTLEGSFSQALPRVGMFSPTFSALIGRSNFHDEFLGNDLSYTYWNVGLTLGFHERWSLDLRYWGTDGEGFAETPLADDRFVATVKYTF